MTKADLNSLKAVWDKKLKDSGFNDIETPDGFLKETSDLYSKLLYKESSSREKYTHFSSKRRYYELADQFTHDHKFDKPIEKFVWERHASGESFRTIAKNLKAKGQTGLSSTTIQNMITRLSAIMLEKNNEQD